jgi:hypothetical protein
MSNEVLNPAGHPVFKGDETHRQDSSGEIHEEHNGHHEHHKENFITKYVFSQDHKMIAKQFLITGMFWAFLGGMLSVIFRVQLGFPNQSFPILETLFGEWPRAHYQTGVLLHAGHDARYDPRVFRIDSRP